MLDDSCDDLFAISDEEMLAPVQTVQSNPVEEHLLKQLTDVQNRIDGATNELDDVKAATARILNVLQWRALYGEDLSSDSDSDLYTVEGEPITKKQKSHKTINIEKNLEIVSQWQCVLQDKWIIGVELQNRSCCKLINLRYYPHVRDQVEICGKSMFWKLNENQWEKIDSICPGAVHIVATIVLDLPTFDRGPVVECWGTISYEINETQFQIPLLSVQLTTAETIDISCIKLLDENQHSAILALKSMSSTERTVNVLFSRDDEDGYESGKKQLFHFLATRSFFKVYSDVFLVKEHGSLMYCLVEVQSIDDGQASIRIFARSINQLNIVLHLLQDEFPNMSVVEEVDDCVEAAMALIRELEMIRDKKSTLEIQEAKIVTDLLIP